MPDMALSERDGGHPPLSRSISFWGMTVAQFLGAFNDNLFKQMVLLTCLDFMKGAGETPNYQSWAQGLFALAFILFSGFGGYLSDRYSKRRIVVLCKVAEILIVLCGAYTLAAGSLPGILVMIFLMGTHSAYFGPPKYGILPELVRDRDLPQANGFFLMTTFLAIIFGTVAGGFLKAKVGIPGETWIVAVTLAGIAGAGTAAACLVRKTPARHPGLPFHWSSLAIDGATFRMLIGDRPLFRALMLSSLFWFIAGVVPPAVNALGKQQIFAKMPLVDQDQRTSLLSACLAIGIAAGCMLAGMLSGHRINFGLVRAGALGIVACLALITGVANLDASLAVVEWTTRGLLVLTGASAGLFSVPIQAFLQSRPPADQKGRVIGAMNLINWIAVFLSAAYYGVCADLLKVSGAPANAIFAVTAIFMVPVAIFYRPPDAKLE